jgi:16S rRNA (cytidine1402-2'-O)-methyltransferase
MSGRYQFIGYLPRRKGELDRVAEELSRWPHSVVAFESPRRLPAALASFAAVMPARPAAVCRELTKRFEEIVRGTLGELAERFAEPPKGEITLVLGPGVDDRRAEVAAESLAAVAELVAAGMTRRQAVDLVARLGGESRNALYRASL